MWVHWRNALAATVTQLTFSGNALAATVTQLTFSMGMQKLSPPEADGSTRRA